MKKIKNIVKNSFNYFKSLILHYADFKYLYKYNNVKGIETKDGQESHILGACHQLEKGLTHKEGSRKFGDSKAELLLSKLRTYQSSYGNSEVFMLGVNVLNSYLKSEFSTDNQALRENIRKYLGENAEFVDDNFDGAKQVKTPSNIDKNTIIEFFNSRSSVRDFSDVPITKDEIKSAYLFASQSPSACNRQSSRVYFFDDRQLMDQIIDNQLGDQGWCRNATGLFVVTAKNCYFNNTYERYQAFIDGGMFAMNLVMGLHLQQIATCFKMYVRDPKTDKEFRKIAGIPEEELPIIVIMAGHYKEMPTFTTHSMRFVPALRINNVLDAE